MDIKEQARRELARRELAKRANKDGSPQFVEEAADISFGDRFKVKSFANSTKDQANYLKQQYPDYDIKDFNDRVLVRKPNESKYKVLDPDADGFDGFGELGKDIADIAVDTGLGAIEGVAAGAAGLATGGVGAIPTAMASAAALESARQGVGQMMGINKDLDYGNIGVAGAISGVVPALGPAFKSASKGALKSGKGALKFISGVTDDSIDVLKNNRNIISDAEANGVVGKLRNKSDAIKSLKDRVNERVYGEAKGIKAGLNVADDQDYKTVIQAEIDAIESSAKQSGELVNPREQKRLDELYGTLGGLESTGEVRDAVVSGLEGSDVIRQQVFPGSLSLDEAVQTMPTYVRESLDDSFKVIGDQYSQILDQGGKVPTHVIYDEFERALKQANTNMGTKWEQEYADLLARELESGFKKANIANQTTGDALSGIKPSTQLDSEIPMSQMMNLKNTVASKAGYDQSLNNNIGKQQATKLQKFYKGLERQMDDALQVMTSGQKSVSDKEYVRLNQARKELDKMFGTDTKAKTTINRALKGDETTVRKLQEFDGLLNTNFASDLGFTRQANETVEKGLQQVDQFKNANVYAQNEAEKLVGQDRQLLNRAGEASRDPLALQTSLGQVKNGTNTQLLEDVANIEAKYGEEAGQSVSELIKELDAINYFADPENFKLFGKSGGGNANNELANQASKVGGVLGWQLGAGGAGAGFGSTLGKGLGNSVQVRKNTKRILDAAFKTDDALKAMDKKTQEYLKRRLLKNVTNGDAIRESVKTRLRVESRD